MSLDSSNSSFCLDLINIFPKHKVFTIHKDHTESLERLLNQNGYSYTTLGGCCKITAIGERMTGVPGVMATIISALSNAGVEILQTADSLTTIACLIKEDQLTEAVTALHKAFNL